MKLCLLHLDDALESQPAFMQAVGARDAQHVVAKESARAVRLWGKQAALDGLQDQLAQQLVLGDVPRLTFMGSGDFHHITALLLPFALEQQGEPVTVIHFDNHPDWVKFEGGMHCGSWVTRALAHPKVAKVITVGVCSGDLKRPEWKGASLSLLASGRLELYPYDHAPSRVRREYGEGASYAQTNGAIHWKTIQAMGDEAFSAHLLSRIATPSVYITVDKDVLARADAITNWDQGRMRLPQVLALLRAIGSRHRIIGADVNGDYSTPDYSGSAWTRLKKRGEILLDQPFVKPDQTRIETNSAANLTLLDAFTEAMA